MSKDFVALPGKKSEAKEPTQAVDELPSSVGQVLAAGGVPLDPNLRAFMEERFGCDFRDVRVHTGAEATESAADVAAKAYTVGNHVVFKEGEYAPDTTDGRRSIAHELAHVVQQERGGGQAPGFDVDHPAEHGADQAADAVVAGGGAVHVSGGSTPGLARQPEDEEKQLYLGESKGYNREVTATKRGRGLGPVRKYFRNVQKMYGGPKRVDISHKDKPFALTPAGEKGQVGLEERTANRKRGAAEREMAAEAEKKGQFVRRGKEDVKAPAKAPPTPKQTLTPEQQAVQNWKPPKATAGAKPAAPSSAPPAPTTPTVPPEQLKLPMDLGKPTGPRTPLVPTPALKPQPVAPKAKAPKISAPKGVKPAPAAAPTPAPAAAPPVSGQPGFIGPPAPPGLGAAAEAVPPPVAAPKPVIPEVAPPSVAGPKSAPVAPPKVAVPEVALPKVNTIAPKPGPGGVVGFAGKIGGPAAVALQALDIFLMYKKGAWEVGEHKLVIDPDKYFRYRMQRDLGINVDEHEGEIFTEPGHEERILIRNGKPIILDKNGNEQTIREFANGPTA